MAQLKDTTVSGNIRVSNEVVATSVQATKIKAPTTSGGTTCGVGSDGQVLKSNGTSTYWGTDNNTTYTFTGGTNGFSVTPSGGSATPVSVTPSIANNVTGNAAWTAADVITTTNASSGNVIKASGKTIATSVTNADTTVPTSKAVKTYVDGLVANATHFMGGFAASGDGIIDGGSTTLKSVAEAVGDLYTCTTAGTIYGIAFEIGDSIIFKTAVAAGTAPTSASFITVEGETSVSVVDNNPTLSWGTKSKVATIEGTEINVTMPSNPNTDTMVTAVGNHYTPSNGSAITPTGDTDTDITNLSSGSGSQVISGVTVDAAGHVTGVTSKKIRSVNTTYTGTGLISINSSNVISTTAEVNQNAFSNVKVGTTTIAADTKTDTLELAAGNGIILTPDATNDKVTINSNIYYGTCTTAASTATKVATLVNSTGFTLTTGVTVKIKFSNYNNASNPTLNVSNTGAIPIMRYGTTAVTTSVQGSWADGAIITLTYDGTNWVLNDKNETYVGTSRYAHTEGESTIASANNAHAEGYSTTASGYASHAEGGCTIASGNNSHAEGGYNPPGGASVIYTIASGSSSHAEGFGTIANHKSQHVFGEFNISDPSTASATDTGNYVEIVGNGFADDARSNARTLDWGGNETLAGSIGIGNGACKLQYNSTTQSCDFIFS